MSADSLESKRGALMNEEELNQLPWCNVSEEEKAFVVKSRCVVQEIVHWSSEKVLVILWPCSALTMEQMFDVIDEMAELQKKYGDVLVIWLRCNDEKPRSWDAFTWLVSRWLVGWLESWLRAIAERMKEVDETFDSDELLSQLEKEWYGKKIVSQSLWWINQWLVATRIIHRYAILRGVPVFSEFLNQQVAPHKMETVTGARIWARTVNVENIKNILCAAEYETSQSGVSPQIIFKNPQSKADVGNVVSKITGSLHGGMYVTSDGIWVPVEDRERTGATEYASILLRGFSDTWNNLDHESMQFFLSLLEKNQLSWLWADLNHDNNPDIWKAQYEVLLSMVSWICDAPLQPGQKLNLIKAIKYYMAEISSTAWKHRNIPKNPKEFDATLSELKSVNEQYYHMSVTDDCWDFNTADQICWFLVQVEWILSKAWISEGEQINQITELCKSMHSHA